MNLKHIIHIALIIACLTGLPILPPAPAQAQTAFDCAAVTEIPQAECQALVALYNATGGDGWYDHTGWLQTTTPCTWRGTTCVNGHVTEMNLAGNELKGSIPPEFGNLSQLTSLDLGEFVMGPVHWEGPILRYNYITALAPEFGNLTHLTYLNLNNNPLTVLPKEFGDLASLTTLLLGNNALTSLPPEFGKLTNLAILELSYTPLTVLPPEFGNLSSLTTLYMGGNYLTTLPLEFGNLSNLTYLNLSNNYSLTALPPEFGKLAKLENLNLSYTSLHNMIPAFMTRLTALQTFYFSDTEWCVPPDGPIRAWLSSISYVYGNGLICTSLTSLNLNSPPEPGIYTGAFFTATVTFDLVQYPVTFTWSTDGVAPIVHTRNTITDSAWLYWDTPGAHTLAITAANEINALSITRTVFVQPISSTVILPDAPASLTYTDTQGLTTTLDLPAGSVTQTVHLLFRPRRPASHIFGSPWRSAGHAFSLNLYREGRALPNPTFTHPLTLTLHYSEADSAGIDRPADLQLMRRDAGGWQPAACGPVSRDLEQRTLSLPLCQLGEFALFGPATLTKFVEPATPVKNGDTLTYTLVFSNPDGGALRLFDPISPTLTWNGFVSPPPSAVFSNVTFTHAASGTLILPHGALSGTLTLSPSHPLTLSFTVRAALPKTAYLHYQSAVSNTAFFCWAQHTACILHPSNTVSTTVLTAFLFIPLLLYNP